MSSRETIERIRVRYGETDRMGHAYYANYLFWFEQARGAWCRDRGFTYLELEALGFMLPCVEVWASYKGEVLYDDLILVRVWISELKRASMKFEYEIVRESTGLVVTTGYSWHVFMGKERKAVTVPQEIREWLTREPGGSERLP